MARPSAKDREEARMLFVTGQVTSNAELARRFKVKPHTIARWRKEDGWDNLRLKAEQRAAEKLVEEITSERIAVNTRHSKFWSLLESHVLAYMKSKTKGELDLAEINKLAAVVERLQKGERLAKEMAMGLREDEIKAAHAGQMRTLVDTFIQAVKENVNDEDTRDRIATAIWRCLPEEPAGRADPPGQEGRG
jgi:transposase